MSAMRRARWQSTSSEWCEHRSERSLASRCDEGSVVRAGLTLACVAQGEVQEVCCGGACNDGLPPECNIDCAVRLPPQ